MTRLEAALLEVAAILDEWRIPYMLIGGLAVAQWGEPRATLDVDVTVWVGADQFEAVVARLASRLVPRTKKPEEFARRTRVLPVNSSNGIPVDIVFAQWPFEAEAIGQAVERTVSGASIRVANLEYLLLLKLVSDRPRDLEDAAALLRRHQGNVDYSALEPQLSEIAEALDQPEIVDRYRRMRDTGKS
jgi:hypothetical protein